MIVWVLSFAIMSPLEVTVWICVAVFGITAVITFLALIGWVQLGGSAADHQYYLRRLFGALILEIVVACVAAFGAYMRTPTFPEPDPAQIKVSASDFTNGSGVAMASGEAKKQYGDVLMNMGPPYDARPNSADFVFRASKAGTYRFWAEYAAGTEERPVKILLNHHMYTENGLGARTGCWEVACQKPMFQGEVQLKEGSNTLRLERSNVFPHIRGFTFEPIK